MKRKIEEVSVIIKLCEDEEKLFDFLQDVEVQNNCNAVLRVAGGWVRDKAGIACTRCKNGI